MQRVPRVRRRSLSSVWMALVPLGLCLLHGSPLWGTEPQPLLATSSPAPTAPTCVDVALRPDGTLWGRIVRPSNAPAQAVAQVPVTFVQGNQVIARVQSNSAGQFAVANLRSGAYRVVVNDSPLGSPQSCRVWTAQAAPPRAFSELALTREPVVVRGQFSAGVGAPTAALTALTAGAITGPIVYNSVHKANQVPISP